MPDDKKEFKVSRIKGISIAVVMSGILIFVGGRAATGSYVWLRDVDDFMKAGDRFSAGDGETLKQEWAGELKTTKDEHRTDMRTMDDRIDLLEQGDVRILTILEMMQKDLLRLEMKLDGHFDQQPD